MKTLIASITALSLATTPVSANEFNEEDFGKFLFGLVAAIAVGAALSKGRDNDAHVASQPAYEPPVVRRTPNNTSPRINPGNAPRPPVVRHTPRHEVGGRRVLPGKCFRQVSTRFGNQNIFAKRCLERNYRHAASLPASCAVRLVTPDGARRGFDPLCLRQAGYSSTRGR